MPTPVFRYPNSDPKAAVIDGSIFAFAQGTDPEVLLVIELIPDQDDGMRWQYGIARMSVNPLHVLYQEDLIWQTTWTQGRDPTSPYFVIKSNDKDDAKITVFD
jgi:hypothetical protein